MTRLRRPLATTPGATQFTRTPNSPSSSASWRVIAIMPPFATAYGPLEPSEPGGMPLRAATEATLTIAPPCFLR